MEFSGTRTAAMVSFSSLNVKKPIVPLKPFRPGFLRFTLLSQCQPVMNAKKAEKSFFMVPAKAGCRVSTSANPAISRRSG
jgi:hypothetical protein